jgi:tRNA (guanine10-N2)-methyltransferase
MTAKQFLVRFVQQHPTFRIPELESCACIAGCAEACPFTFVEYDDEFPVVVLELASEAQAAAIVGRTILAQYDLDIPVSNIL